MNRRNFMALIGASLGTTPVLAPAMARGQGLPARRDLAQIAAPLWTAWKEGYLQPDGRVLDRLQSNASHSEGQGYGMILATEFNDPEAFRRMYDWAELNLAIRGDALLAWRYMPHLAERVPDLNNASDGDLFYAWALLRASRQFADRGYFERASSIARALEDSCIRPSPENPETLVFLPAAQGFAQGNRVVVNPSYLMPLAMRELGTATGVEALTSAAVHGEAMLARLAVDGLVPDWVRISGDGIAAAEGFSANSGYEAMRVPLFLVWSGATGHPAVQQMARYYARALTPGAPVPTLIEPASGVVLEASTHSGYRALAALMACAGQAGQVGSTMPSFETTQPYYPATLHMFAVIAANQVSPECVPV